MATTTLLDPFGSYRYSQPCDISYKQMVYLFHNGISIEDISTITKYALRTVKTYVKQYAYLLTEAQRTFYVITRSMLVKWTNTKLKVAKEKAQWLAEEKVRREEAQKRYLQHIAFCRDAERANYRWERWAVEKKNANRDSAFVYCVSYYDRNDKLIYHKIGQTHRYPDKRLNELMKDYNCKDNAYTYKVHKIINVPSEFAAKSIEALLQNYYYQRGATMIPQDRFKGIDFDFKSMWHDECINSAIKSIIRMN